MVKPPTGLPSILKMSIIANIAKIGKSPVSVWVSSGGLKNRHIIWKTGYKSILWMTLGGVKKNLYDVRKLRALTQY